MTKIALIEDNTVISQMYRMKFESEGFDVKLATNGKNGIALVKDFSPDIILLDYSNARYERRRSAQKNSQA